MIRPATPADIPVVLAMIREMAVYLRSSGELEIDETKLERYVFSSKPLAEVFLGFVDAAPVAYAMIYLVLVSFRCQPVLYIEDIFVSSEARGRGHGLAMFRFLARLALERECCSMAWSVRDWNETAIRFYDKAGAQRETGRYHYDLSREDLERLA